MIIDEQIEINMNGRKLSWYRDKGYKVAKESVIFVSSLDLPPNSKTIIQAECDECGDIRQTMVSEYTPLCIKCSCTKNSPFKNMVGSKNIHYNPTYSDEERELVLKQSRGGKFGVWALDVKKKDGFKCVLCLDDKGGNLNSHHLNSFGAHPSGRTDILNGICLCERCHKEFHKEYGNKVNTREQFEIFALNKLEELHG